MPRRIKVDQLFHVFRRKSIRHVIAKNEAKLAVSLLTFIGVALGFYFRFLFIYTGYPGWGNFFTPLSSNSLIWSMFFNPYQFNSIPSIAPETSFLTTLFFNVPLWTLSKFTSMSTAGRIYVFGSTVFFMATGYLVASQFTRLFYVRVLSVLFLAFNPFIFMILSAGDSLALIAQGFTFIALYLMLLDTRKQTKFPGRLMVLSWIALCASLLSYQGFFLGTALYCIVFVVFRYRVVATGTSYWSRHFLSLIYVLGTLLISLGVLIILILPDIAPLLEGGIYSGTYVSNPGLGALIGSSVPPLELLLLKGYPPNLAWVSLANISPTLTELWLSAEALLIGFLLVSPLLLRNARRSLITLAIMGAALLGAAADSPLYYFVKYMFLHLPGYGSLNAPYFWDWFIIVPLYFILFVLLLDDMCHRLPHSGVVEQVQLFDMRNSFGKLYTRPRFAVRTLVTTIFVLLVVFVLATPVLFQGYYNYPYGINNTWASTMPRSYATIEPELARLLGDSSGGVAYFNPDNNLNFSGSSNYFENPLISFPEHRTASITYYAAPQTTSNRFFYWVYTIFYENKTRYLGQLMALGGIEMFVVLNGTNSYSYGGTLMPTYDGKNASQLMNYQYDVIRTYVGVGYAIYRNLAYGGTANVVSGDSIVAGGFQELNVLPYFGFNLSSQVPILSEDLSPALYASLIPHTKLVVTPSFNALYSIVLPSIGDSESLADFATSLSPSDGWTSTSNIPESNFYVYDSVSPAAVTVGLHSLTVPLKITSSGNYSVWFDAYYSEDSDWKGGSLRIEAGNRSITLNSGDSYQGLSNTFVWQNLNAYLSPGEALTFQSLGGWNALDRVFLVPSDLMQTAFQAFNNTLDSYGISLYQVTAGSIIAVNPVDNSTKYQMDTTGSANVPYGQVSYLSSQLSYSTSMTLIVPKTKNVSLCLQVLDSNGALFDVTNGNTSVTLGFNAQNFTAPSNSTVSSLVVPFQVLATGTLEIRLLEGFAFIAGVGLIPGTVYPTQQATIPSEFGISYVYAPPGQNISNFTSTQTVSQRTLKITTSVDFSASAPAYIPLLSIGFNQTFPYNESLHIGAQIEPYFYLYVNSVLLGQTPTSGFYIGSNTFGSQDFVYAHNFYIDVYSNPFAPEVLHGHLTFSAYLSFYSNNSAYAYSGKSQLRTNNDVIYNMYGYSVQDCQGLTWVRLPYYGQMQGPHLVGRYPIDSSVSQMLIVPSRMSVTIEVSYAGETMTFFVLGVATVLGFFVAGFVVRPRRAKGDRLRLLRMSNVVRQLAKKLTSNSRRKADGEIGRN